MKTNDAFQLLTSTRTYDVHNTKDNELHYQAGYQLRVTTIIKIIKAKRHIRYSNQTLRGMAQKLVDVSD